MQTPQQIKLQVLIESLESYFPALKKILTCPPNQLIKTIMKISDLPETDTRSRKKYSSWDQHTAYSHLLEQFKKVTDWNCNHMQLFNNLLRINKSFQLNLNPLYKPLLLQKIDNGMDFLHIFNSVSQIPVFGYETDPGKIFEKINKTQVILKKCYEVTRPGFATNNPEYEIYVKRYQLLSEQDKVKYQLKLIQEETNPIEKHHRIYKRQMSNEMLSFVQNLYNQVKSTDYLWLLEELLKIECPKTAQYMGLITSLKLIMAEQCKTVIINGNPNLNPKHLTQQIMRACLKSKKQTSHIFGEVYNIESSEKLYMKFDLSLIEIITSQCIGSLTRLLHLKSNKQSCLSIMQQNAKAIISSIQLIVNTIKTGKPIFVYESGQFIKITRQKEPKILYFCLGILSKLQQMRFVLSLQKQLLQILEEYQIVSTAKQILLYAYSRPLEQISKATLVLFCEFIEEYMHGLNEIQSISNIELCDLLYSFINIFVSDKDLTALPKQIQLLIVNHLPILPEYQCQRILQTLNLSRIFELKFKDNESEISAYKIEFQVTNKDDDKQIARISHKHVPLQAIVDVIPNGIICLSQVVSKYLLQLPDDLQRRDIFGNPDYGNLKSLLKVISNTKIKIPTNFYNAIKKIIQRYPTFASNNSYDSYWIDLSPKLMISDELIFKEVNQALQRLRAYPIFSHVQAQQLSQMQSSSNKQLIKQVNTINYLNILFKLRAKNPVFPCIRQLVQLMLIAENIQAESVDKIAAYQASLPAHKIKQLQLLYLNNNDKTMLFFKIKETAQRFLSTCWKLISELDMKNINIFLKQFSLYFEAMNQVENKTLLLRLVKTYNNLKRIGVLKNCIINYQFYNHNKDIINQCINTIFSNFQYREKYQQFEIGEPYLVFLAKCRCGQKNPRQQLSDRISSNIRYHICCFVDFILYQKNRPMIFNSKSYSSFNLCRQQIQTAIFEDILKRINKTNIHSFLCYYNQLFTYMQKERRIYSDTITETDLELEIPVNNLQLRKQDQNIYKDEYLAIIEVVNEVKYCKNKVKMLQDFFFQLLKTMKEKYNVQYKIHPLLENILKDIEKANSQELDAQTFKIQNSWISLFYKKGSEVPLSQAFLNGYFKLVDLVLNNMEKYKESLGQDTLQVLQKLIAKTFTSNKEELVKYTLKVMPIVLKVAQNISSIPFQAVRSIALSLIKAECALFQPFIYQFVFVLHKKGFEIRTLLCQIAGKQVYNASIQADIKGLFLKQSEMLVDQSEKTISIKMSTFIKVFQSKYTSDSANFSHIASKLLKMTVKNVDGKETTLLSYEKCQPFSYSQILKKDFAKYEPSSSVKLLIKDLLDFKDKQSLNKSLKTFKYLFYELPIMIPYVMQHHIHNQSGQQQFIDYLIGEVNTQIDQEINKFLLFACLDHRCIIKNYGKNIFYSQYICYRIIKKLIELGINQFNIMLIRQLVSLKHFASLSTVKLCKSNQVSLQSTLIKYLKDNRVGFHYQSQINCIIYEILTSILLQNQSQNLKKLFIPKKIKGAQRRYKLFNECLVPFDTFYPSEIALIKNRNTLRDQIVFTGNTETPFYSEISETKLLDQEYEMLTPIYEIEYIQCSLAEYSQWQQLSISQNIIKSFSPMSFQQRSYDIQKLFNKGQQPENPKKIQNDPGLQVPTSLYAQQDFSNISRPQQNHQVIKVQSFDEHLRIIPSEQAKMPIQQLSQQQEETMNKQCEQIIKRINQRLESIGKQPLKINQFDDKDISMKHLYLQNKEIEIDFDINKERLSPWKFEEYLLSNAIKFQRLSGQRKEELIIAEEIMFTANITRNFSSDSINYMIDTIDQNYQHLANIERVRSDDSTNKAVPIIDEKAKQFDVSSLSPRLFSDVPEQQIYQMLLSLYYQSNKNDGWHLIHLLSNKKVQDKLVTTLLYLMKNPFKNKHFPQCCYKESQTKEITELVNWQAVKISQANQSVQTNKFVQKVLTIFLQSKLYRYYPDDGYLHEEISNEGYFGIEYEPIAPSQQNDYIPINDILSYSLKLSTNFSLLMMKGVKRLAPGLLNATMDILVKSQSGHNLNEGRDYLFQANIQKMPSPFPYQFLTELYKDKEFQQMFTNHYKANNKKPSAAFLVHLIESGVYTNEELKAIHLKILADIYESSLSLKFLNKVISVYTDEELREAKWINQYQQSMVKVINFVNDYGKSTQQPIWRILQATDLGFQIKKAIFEYDVKKLKEKYPQKQTQQVFCKRQKGIFESAFESLRYRTRQFWINRLIVKFINQSGDQESGYGEGVLREWFTLLSKAIVNLNYALFSRTPKNYYFFSRESYVNPRHLQYYEFIGKLFAFALNDRTLFVSPSFSLLLYKLLLSQEITIEDVLQEFEEEAEYVRGLQQMIKGVKSNEDILAADLKFTYFDKRLISSANYNLLKDKQGDKAIGKKVELLCTKEEVIMELHSEEDKQTLPAATKVIKVTDIIELKAGGADIQVTIDNMHQYLTLTKQKILELVVGSVKKQFQAFKQGFKQIISPKMLRRFNSKELKLLIQGVNEISIQDIKEYTNNEDVEQPVIQHFWSVLEQLSSEDRALFLWNWTGVDKMPVEGAKIMELSLISTSRDFIISHTCYGQLQIPNCGTREKMEEAVLVVMNNIKSGMAIIED